MVVSQEICELESGVSRLLSGLTAINDIPRCSQFEERLEHTRRPCGPFKPINLLIFACVEAVHV